MRGGRLIAAWWLVLAAGCGGSIVNGPEPTALIEASRQVGDVAPTVILISIDTLRADRLGCYGSPAPTSPAIDRFREQSVLFEWAIAQAPSTLPSHATMLTSLLPEHHGAFFARRAPLPTSIPTLATVLEAAGYRTAAFTGGGQIAPEFGLDRGFEIYGVNQGGADFQAAVEAGLEWLARDHRRPSFLFLHTYEVHHPYEPEPELLAIFDDGYDGFLAPHVSKEDLERINRGETAIGRRDLDHIIAAYDAEIRSVDEAFAALVAGLEELGLDDDALIVFTSDHGEELGEHGVVGWHSHTLYDELLRVPLVIRFPGGRYAGSTVDAQVRLLDLAPTVLGAAGVDEPEGFEGVDLTRVLTGLATPLPAVSQLDLPFGEDQISLRTARWKLYPRAAFAGDPFADGPPPLAVRARNFVKRWRRPFALFDLEADPGEAVDVNRAHEDVGEALRRTLGGLRAARREPPPAPTVIVDVTTEERLRALGYLE
jgi:arylsulfatase A-like enzyme